MTDRDITGQGYWVDIDDHKICDYCGKDLGPLKPSTPVEGQGEDDVDFVLSAPKGYMSPELKAAIDKARSPSPQGEVGETWNKHLPCSGEPEPSPDIAGVKERLAHGGEINHSPLGQEALRVIEQLQWELEASQTALSDKLTQLTEAAARCELLADQINECEDDKAGHLAIIEPMKDLLQRAVDGEDSGSLWISEAREVLRAEHQARCEEQESRVKAVGELQARCERLTAVLEEIIVYCDGPGKNYHTEEIARAARAALKETDGELKE